MNKNAVVKKVVDYIETHIEEDLPLDKIADTLNYSKFYLARIFTEETKCTVYKYIQGRRLTLAAQKLVETEQPIVEIAYEAHYDSQQAFTLAFKQVYGCTPKIYRKNGVFYPKQSKISMMSSLGGYTYMYCLTGGELAA
ncbi:MAG: AraC family transcriptional regulator [Acetatifactor sp.]|nr:AraC family transcriptional regulator [Acetatifactor sp.]